MNETLVKLKARVFNGGWDEESKQMVRDYEIRLAKLAATENLLNVPAIKEWYDYLSHEAARCRILRTDDRTLTDRQRDQLFATEDACTKFTSMLDGKEREHLEESINKLLNVATS